MMKPTDEHYRAAAQRIFRAPGLTLSSFAAVKVVFDEGAFVEMMAWVPRAEAACEGESLGPLLPYDIKALRG